jgi:hypothetical protein
MFLRPLFFKMPSRDGELLRIPHACRALCMVVFDV